MSSSSSSSALNDSLLAINAERATGSLLERLVETARDLVDARFAALGIPDGEGGFAQFLTAGMTPEQIEAIGPLPRVHGMLGAMLAETKPYRTPDITTDPRWRYWPPAHPHMSSFLGVPVLVEHEVIAAFYLTDKKDAPGFTAEDEELIGALAAHAAVAIENARLWEQARERLVIEERARVARELHDAMSQNLFSLQLTVASALDALPDDPAAARERLATVRELARAVQGELRALVVDLRPPDLDAEGLAQVLRKHVALLARAHRADVRADAENLPELAPSAEQALLRIAQEALHNALRHADAKTVDVRLARTTDGVVLEVRDDGVGFDPANHAGRANSLGIVSMRHRARGVGGRLDIDSAPGKGTTVRVTVDD